LAENLYVIGWMEFGALFFILFAGGWLLLRPWLKKR
jgi:hypothetical protein